jgi:30S ribosomal protein S31
MGKGDQRSAKGKRYRGTHGKTRPKKPRKAKKGASRK